MIVVTACIDESSWTSRFSKSVRNFASPPRCSGLAQCTANDTTNDMRDTYKQRSVRGSGIIFKPIQEPKVLLHDPSIRDVPKLV